MDNPITTAFLDAFAAAWNRHDADAILAMMTPDCVMYLSGDPQGLRRDGPAAVRAAATELFRAMPDARWNKARHFIADDRAVTQWVFTATRPDGSKIEAVGCDIFTFRNGLIAVKDSYRKQVAY